MDPQGNDPGVETMLAYQAGDDSAFERLVHGYSGQVYALLTRFLGPVAAREDLVQEVFLRVIRARDRYQPSARFSTWLYRIVFNLCVNEKDRLARRLEVSLEGTVTAEVPGAVPFADEDAPDPSSGLEREDAVVAVRRAIGRLPEAQRMALLLAKYEELSYAEIARVMDSSEKAIKSLVHRARENLRAALRAYLVEDVA